MRERRIFKGDGWIARVRLFPDPTNPQYRSIVLHELAAATTTWQVVSRRAQDHDSARREYDTLIGSYEEPSHGLITKGHSS